MIITAASSDQLYFDQLLSMLSSFEVNCPNKQLSIFLTDYPKDIAENLKRAFPSFLFFNRSLSAIDKRGIHFILFRISLIRECFEKYKSAAAWIDTDVVIRKPLDEFLAIEPTQLKILYRGDNKPDKVKFNAGIFRIGCSDATKKLINDWYSALEKNAIWGMGQLELWKAYYKNRKMVELVKMEEKFNDLGGNDRPNAFSKESVMWHSKKAHFENKKFQKEFQYYLEIGRDKYVYNKT